MNVINVTPINIKTNEESLKYNYLNFMREFPQSSSNRKIKYDTFILIRDMRIIRDSLMLSNYYKA